MVGSHCDGSGNSNLFAPNTGPHAGNAYSVLGSSFVPFPTAGTNPPAAFNSQPYIFMTREDDRANAAVLGHLKVTDYFQPYAEFYFMDDRTDQAVAPAAAFSQQQSVRPHLETGGYPINCNNPLLSAQQRSTLCTPAQIAAANANPTAGCTLASPGVLSANCADVDIGRRNLEGGGRTSDFEHENYRAVVGSKGDLLANGGLTYDLYGQYYYTTFTNNNLKYFNFQALDNALQVYNNGGTPTCVSGPPCVPYNIFNDGGVTQAALNYLYINGIGIGSSTLRTEHGELTAQLGTWGVTSPFAHDGVAVNAGFEHRNDHEFFEPDYAEQNQLLSGFGSAATAIDDSLSSTEGFTEIRAPLMQDVPGAKELLFDTAYRYSAYNSNSGANNIQFEAHTYKFEVQYAPIQDVRLRIGYDKAIRAPSVIELYNPELVGLIQSGNDPCAPPVTLSAGAVRQAGRLGRSVRGERCGRSGRRSESHPAVQSGQCSQLTGGKHRAAAGTGRNLHHRHQLSAQLPAEFLGQPRLLSHCHRDEVNVLPASSS